ncbi:hypothetical protein D3C85_563390 [compost metagenome]
MRELSADAVWLIAQVDVSDQPAVAVQFALDVNANVARAVFRLKVGLPGGHRDARLRRNEMGVRHVELVLCFCAAQWSPALNSWGRGLQEIYT